MTALSTPRTRKSVCLWNYVQSKFLTLILPEPKSLTLRLSVRLSVCPSQNMSEKLLVRFHPSFTGMISTMSNCAY